MMKMNMSGRAARSRSDVMSMLSQSQMCHVAVYLDMPPKI